MDDGEHVKEVYAHFGLAIYLAQCLEQSIYIHLMFFDFFPRNISRIKTQELWQKEIEAYEAQELSKTMGQLFQRLKDAGQPTDDIATALASALKQRNRLVHNYFSEKSITFMSESGRNSMIAELQSIQEQFQAVAKMIDAVTQPVAEHYGFSEEKQKKLMAQMLEDEAAKKATA